MYFFNWRFFLDWSSLSRFYSIFTMVDRLKCSGLVINKTRTAFDTGKMQQIAIDRLQNTLSALALTFAGCDFSRFEGEFVERSKIDRGIFCHALSAQFKVGVPTLLEH